jgi:hypothetical protein
LYVLEGIIWTALCTISSKILIRKGLEKIAILIAIVGTTISTLLVMSALYAFAKIDCDFYLTNFIVSTCFAIPILTVAFREKARIASLHSA